MKIHEYLDQAIHHNDTVPKALLAIKLINNAIPFENRHYILKDASIVKPLLMLYPYIKDSIDMILNQLLEIFKSSIEWINNCLKAISDFASLSQKVWPVINEAKIYALDYFETVLHTCAEQKYELDDKCCVFVAFLKHAEKQELMLTIMDKIQIVKSQFQYKLRSLHAFEELVEQTVLQLYQDEQQAMTVSGHKPVMVMEIVSATNIRIQDSQDSVIEEPLFDIDIELLLSQNEKPEIAEDQIEYFQNMGALEKLVNFITDPLDIGVSDNFDNDSLAGYAFTVNDDAYRKPTPIIKWQYTLRSYKALLFLTNLKNHSLMQENNQHAFNLIFRCISGYFQNSQSKGNLNHIVALLQFYLKHNAQQTIHHILSLSMHLNMLDFLYNSYIFDFLMRILDPLYSRIPPVLHEQTWLFLKESNFIGHIVSRICNRDNIHAFRLVTTMSNPMQEILRKLHDLKLEEQEDEDTKLIYNQLHNALDQVLGVFYPGKTAQQGQLNRQGIKYNLLRKHTNLNNAMLVQQMKQFVVHEYVSIQEMREGGRDVDNFVQDVVEYKYDGIRQRTQESRGVITDTGKSLSAGAIIQYMQLQVRQSQNVVVNVQQRRKTSKDSIKLYNGASHQHSIYGSQMTSNKHCQYYPNSDNQVLDVLMTDESMKYNQMNNQAVAQYHVSLLYSITQCFNSINQHTMFDCLLDDKLISLEKLMHHYNMKITSFSETEECTYELGYIIKWLLDKLLKNKQKFTEASDKILYYQLPKLCRNIVSIYSRNNQSTLQIQSTLIPRLDISLLHLSQCIQQIIQIKSTNQRILFKFNDSAMHILQQLFYQHTYNNIYQHVYVQIIKTLLMHSNDKQLLTQLFKINLVEGISTGYQQCVINQVIMEKQNIKQYLFYLAYMSQIIISALEQRNELAYVFSSLQRCNSYEQIKQLLKIYSTQPSNIMIKATQYALTKTQEDVQNSPTLAAKHKRKQLSIS